VAAKPIIDIKHRGKKIVINFALDTRLCLSMRYDIFVNGHKTKANLFAEEVMRWLGNVMHDETHTK
jgi:hypothetical protein